MTCQLVEFAELGPSWRKRCTSCAQILAPAHTMQEEAVVLANVAEQAERYDDMVEYMKALGHSHHSG